MNELITEAQQRDWAAFAVTQSRNFEVASQGQYDNAAEMLKDIKFKIKTVSEAWKEIKSKAYDSWKQICNTETIILAPFEEAEKVLKGKMAAWKMEQMEIERKAREEFERQKREQEAELLAAAIKAEAEGKADTTEFMMQAAESVSRIEYKPEVVKTVGTSAITVWKAKITNDSLVPVEFAGMTIRPVDLSAIDKLAKTSKGKMKIPGVEFYEDIQIRSR